MNESNENMVLFWFVFILYCIFCYSFFTYSLLLMHLLSLKNLKIFILPDSAFFKIYVCDDIFWLVFINYN